MSGGDESPELARPRDYQPCGPEDGALAAGDAQGWGLVVKFSWRLDRFVHTVLAPPATDGPEAGWRPPLLTSREDGTSGNWPASPPLQQLELQDLSPGGGLALLVGKAGSSHWSVSLETAGSDPQLVFDAACRIHQPPDWLGSQYLVPRAPERLVDGREAFFACAGGCLRLAVEPVPQQPLAHLEVIGQHLAIVPALASDALPATVRWRYRCQLLRGRGRP